MQSVNKKASIITAIALSTVLSQSVLANEPATPINTVTSSDLSYAFDESAGPVQVLALSDQEMKETEGAFIPNAIGAGLGMVGYGTACLIQSNCTGAGFGYAAATGAISPVSGAMATVWGFNGAIAAGTGWGVGSQLGWW